MQLLSKIQDASDEVILRWNHHTTLKGKKKGKRKIHELNFLM